MKEGAIGICKHCNCQIKPGQAWGCEFGEDFHAYLAVCITATKLATARRCAEIADKYRDALTSPGDDIREEFGIEEPK